MDDPSLLPVLVRIVTAATVVILASLASERAGPFWGAIVVSLPVSAGPAYVLLAMEQDTAFLSATALSSLSGFMATPVFLVAYSRLAPKNSAAVSGLGALVVWALAVSLLRQVPWTLTTALVGNLIVFPTCMQLSRKALTVKRTSIATASRWFDLPLRAASVAILVALAVTYSGTLGPGLMGIAAIAPVASMSLALAIHPRVGGETTAATMAATIRTMPGIGVGFTVLHLTAVPMGAALSLTLALIASVSWPFLLIGIRAHRERRARPA